MDSGNLLRRKDAEEAGSSQQRCHSKSRRRSDSRFSPEGYSFDNFMMGIKHPSNDINLDRKLYELLKLGMVFRNLVFLWMACLVQRKFFFSYQ